MIKELKFKEIRLNLILVVLLSLIISGFMYLENLANTMRQKENIVLAVEQFDIDIEDSEDIENETTKKLNTEIPKVIGIKDEIKDKYSLDEGIYNILVCGVEKIGGGLGRTDTIMVATLNTKTNKIKLTSLMRDVYVKISGYSDNKLNASYSQGGIDLLIDTVYTNFNIKIDGYVKVDFDQFEHLIDSLGGVEINLTLKEANYLNKTNYISKEEHRNVVEGKQILNGNQALGYSRVRYVATEQGLHNDFGRNERQRNVILSIINSYKSKNVAELISLLPDITSTVETDISNLDIIKYLYAVMKTDLNNIETSRIPMDGVYEDRKVRKMSVLYITDTEKLIRNFTEFVNK